MHFLGMEFSHLGGVEAREVWPTGLEDEFVDIDGG